jgi:hypothetical protein
MKQRKRRNSVNYNQDSPDLKEFFNNRSRSEKILDVTTYHSPSALSQTVEDFERLRSILIYGSPFGLVFAIFTLFRFYTTVGLWTVSTCSFFLFSILVTSLWIYVLNRLNSVLSGLAKPCYEIVEYESREDFADHINANAANKITQGQLKLLLQTKCRSLIEAPTLRPLDHSIVKKLFNRDYNDDDYNDSKRRYLLIARFSDRLGNNLFQYVYARILASVLQIPFICPEKLQAPFDSLDLLVMPQVETTKTRIKQDLTLPISTLDFLSTPTSNYAMNTKLYSRELMHNIVNNWLWPSVYLWRKKRINQEKGKTLDLSSSDIVIHIRLGDILWGHHAAYRPLPITFYLSAIDHIYTRKIKTVSSLSPVQIVIVTDDPKHEIIERTRKIIQHYLQGDVSYGHNHRGSSFGAFKSTSSSSSSLCSVIVQSVSIAHDFNTLLSAKYGLILSVSSFSWWAAAMLHWFINRIGSSEVYKFKTVNEEKGSEYKKKSTEKYDDDNDGTNSDGFFRPILIVPRYGLFLQQIWTPAPRLCPSAANIDHCLCFDQEVGEVLDVDLSTLERWKGNTKSAIESLFEHT